MRISRFLIALLGSLALTAMPILAEDGGKAPLLSSDLPKIGVGAYGNFGFGSPGPTMAPGLSVILNDCQAGLHFASSGGMFQIAANGDWFYLNQSLAGAPLSFFAGPGLYAAIASDFKDDMELGAGLRGVAGIRTIAFGMLEAHLALVPAVGYVFSGDKSLLNWSVGIEVGLRYVVPRKTGMSLSASRPETPWTPDGDGLNDDLALKVNLLDDYPVATWSFSVTDPTGKPFYSLTSDQPLPAAIAWNGDSDKGEKVVSMQNYGYSLTATDVKGVSKTTTGLLPVDMVFIRKGNDFKLDLTGFIFGPNSPKLVDDGSDAAKENRRLLAALKSALERMSMYNTTIVGHAVNVSGTEKEEKELLPLSVARAETIKTELQKLGLDVSGVGTAGKGGTEPIVPHSDLENRWKNRRVEFLMTPKGAAK